MNFTNRLLAYIIGVFIGSMFVLIFFGDRISCSYLPNERVLKDMKSKVMNIYEKNIDTIFINEVLSKGEVIFEESNKVVNDSCKQYKIKYKDKKVIINNCDKSILVMEIKNLDL